MHFEDNYESYDKIEIPVLFYLTDEGKRVYDSETMKEILSNHIESIIEHEKNYE